MTDAHSVKHLAWLWLWFAVGMGTYMLKRAYYLVKGPQPVATTYKGFINVAWIPLLVRTVVDSGIYWGTFTPQVLKAGLDYMGWGTASGVVNVVTQFGVCALFFGLGVDAVVDVAVTKIPFLKDWLPQMPPPLSPPRSTV